MTNIKKYIDTASENGWIFEQAPGELRFARMDHTIGDGYPAVVVVKHDAAGEATTGSVWNTLDPYGELEEFEVGTRNLLAVLAEVGNPFRYKPFHEAFMAGHPVSISEKVLAARINESERQVRNARIMGFMSGYLADKLCVVVLGKHPMEVYGYGAWIEHESKGAWPVPSRRRKS